MPGRAADVRLFSFSRPVWLVIHGHRIIEIEWAVKNNKEFVPSPKRARQPKTKKRSKSNLARENAPADDAMEVDECGAIAGKHRDAPGMFGAESTNTDSPNKSKRSYTDAADLEGMSPAQTPMKRQKRYVPATPVVNVSSEDETEEMVLPRKSRRNVVS